jgi:hypothetical protein
MDEQELRKVVILLVKAISRTRRNLMAANMALHAISNMPPAERAALKAATIASERKSIEQQLEAQPDPAIVRILGILDGSGDYLEPLRVFASQLHW